MRTFRLDKLVRDKIVVDMLQLGQQVVSHQLNDAEFTVRLAEKLVEEAKEIKIDDKAAAVRELADLLEVVETLSAQLGMDFDGLLEIKAGRREKRGGFNNQVFVETVTVADDDPWGDYYARDPEKYPEIKEGD